MRKTQWLFFMSYITIFASINAAEHKEIPRAPFTSPRAEDRKYPGSKGASHKKSLLQRAHEQQAAAESKNSASSSSGAFHTRTTDEPKSPFSLLHPEICGGRLPDSDMSNSDDEKAQPERLTHRRLSSLVAQLSDSMHSNYYSSDEDDNRNSFAVHPQSPLSQASSHTRDFSPDYTPAEASEDY